ncbi:hypothetical protein [Methanoregula formicica]|uniref:Uncharacterized protein n=1 Tax=Methanoregula formicica (strain DSM 22288 / NBRC 105244 / SMSP) TaxID=593750 RepID=L0HIH8_METFS|nr:hypothetical protein [Methanoregula formicica]AGB02884.1 hypothetical protein Metfor_1863 [Methanoregula formicica SMSP]
MNFPYPDPLLLFALLALALYILIPSALAAGFAVLLFCLLDRIRSRRVQIALVLAVGILFIVGERSFHVFAYQSLGANELMLLGPLFSLIDMIPLALILGTGVIVSFLLIRDHLGLKRAWAGVFVAGTIAIGVDFVKNFLVAFGPPNGRSTAIYSMPYYDLISKFGEVLLIFVAASAVFGMYIFIRYAATLAAGHRSKRGIHAAVVIGLLVTLPAAAVGGLAVYLATLCSKCSGRLVPILLALGAMVVVGTGGSFLMGIPDIERMVGLFIIPTIVMALAAIIPFVYFSRTIPKTWQPVILFTGTAAADLALSAIAVLLDLGDRLTSDPITILTFAEGGIILAALAFAAGNYLVARLDHAGPVPVVEELP